MKVLMTADTVGGVWTYAVELIRALEPYGVRFLLATMGRPLSLAQWEDVRSLRYVELAESAYRLEWMPDPWHDVDVAGEWLLALERRFRPDVIHLNGYAHASLPFSAPVLTVGHSCVLSWWRAVKGEEAPAEPWNRYARAVRNGLHAADLIAAPTAAILAQLDRFYGPFPEERIAVLPNCRSGALFFPGPHRAKEPMVFSAGRLWDEAKNVRALSNVATNHSLPWPVVVAGETRDPGGSPGWDETRPEGRVHFAGPLSPEQVACWMRRAAIYALPARYEPFGLSALEAALSGCALVLGDIDSLREVWADAALYVAPDDDAALAEAISRLAGDEQLRARLAESSLERARTLYTPERTAKAYLQAYCIK